ncbi:hypothetical protein ABB37_01299 [Leptomonas pyrrhocoris]|uniref:Uncharacterized protein n=1 Tax=Leptomonas pyrrhocoris TaxID=157538 RepID=A0A0N0DZ62_LEPPY|nr:hypothetical protein ABB37_01299 [Leptomonas pyrrhocoris]KPA84822.1 hypothetical protein ABB37_01299 [Leptomonas pyrrhocoris]|eukprot:XP_015663261.1 hypothetical protein ABB37_01299 [Leptomonas pyrrhocoris]
MNCYERNSASIPSSSNRSRDRDELRSSKVPVTQIGADSPFIHSVDAHPSSRLPSLRHTTAPSSYGLVGYFQGLAAGDDLGDLIRGLRRSIWSCYQECLCKTKTSSSSSVVNPTGAETDGAAAAAVEANIPAPAAPHRLPAGTLSASQRREYWSATRTAFLFSAESPSAAEEATKLHCSPVTRSLLYPYCYSVGEAGAPDAAALPLGRVLRSGDMKMIWSDARMAELAREEVRRNPRDGWQQALRLLHQVSPTPLTCAVELELYRQTDGQHWVEALRSLWCIPPAQWTEMDVGAALRSLYHAGRRARRAKPPATQSSISSSLPSPASTSSFESDLFGSDGGAADTACDGTSDESTEVFLARLIAQALRIHRAVEETGALQWSTPSAFNDTLGLFALDPTAWREACLLLDKLIAARGCTMEEAAPSPAAASIPPNVSNTADPQRASQGILSTQASAALYQHMRPNPVTIHQTCRVFQQHWDVGLQYVQRLQRVAGDALHLCTDIVATEDVLRLCIAGQRWQEALRLVVSYEAAVRDQHTANDSSSLSTCSSSSSSPSTFSRPRGVSAELMSARQHFRPDVFVQLVRLLGSVPECRPVAYALVRRHDTRVSSPRASLSPMQTDVPPLASTLPRVDLSRSKLYNDDTLSRAYNCLLQGSATLHAADALVKELNQLYGADVSTPSSSALPLSVVSDFDAKIAGLETESVAHIAYLCCTAGNWQRALHHTNALLHSPRYRATFIPTARLHDAVQYALEQAPPPGPSWELSMKLFTDMMDRNVPISEVSFQSVVKRCFAGGAPEQAQRVFQMVMRRGVRS